MVQTQTNLDQQMHTQIHISPQTLIQVYTNVQIDIKQEAGILTCRAPALVVSRFIPRALHCSVCKTQTFYIYMYLALSQHSNP